MCSVLYTVHAEQIVVRYCAIMPQKGRPSLGRRTSAAKRMRASRSVESDEQHQAEGERGVGGGR